MLCARNTSQLNLPHPPPRRRRLRGDRRHRCSWRGRCCYQPVGGGARVAAPLKRGRGGGGRGGGGTWGLVCSSGCTRTCCFGTRWSNVCSACAVEADCILQGERREKQGASGRHGPFRNERTRAHNNRTNLEIQISRAHRPRPASRAVHTAPVLIHIKIGRITSRQELTLHAREQAGQAGRGVGVGGGFAIRNHLPNSPCVR